MVLLKLEFWVVQLPQWMATFHSILNYLICCDRFRTFASKRAIKTV